MTKLSLNKLHLVALTVFCVLFLQSCSSLKSNKSENKKLSKILKTSLPPKYENFDRKAFPNQSFVIANMIAVVQPELDGSARDEIATQISKAINVYKVEPQIIVAIIDTESDFKAEKVSSTGDVSLAQINVEVWNREFVRMKMKPMNREKIIKDQQYALIKMAEILSIIKKRYEKKDRRWYARYHSNTHNHKKDYLHKLEIRLKMLAISTSVNIKLAEN